MELLNEDLKTIEKWASQWKLKLSISKTVAIMFSRKIVPPTEHPLLLNNISLKNVKFHKHLSITFSADMQWSHHFDCVTSHAYKRINMMRFLKYKLALVIRVYRPVLEYGDIVYSSCKKANAAKLESFQNDALRIIAGAKKITSIFLLLNETGVKHWKRVEMHIA